jgi:hypothetical protein
VPRGRHLQGDHRDAGAGSLDDRAPSAQDLLSRQRRAQERENGQHRRRCLPLAIKLRRGAITGTIGIAGLASVALGRPVLLLVAENVAKLNPGRPEMAARLAQPDQRRVVTILTAIIAATFAIDGATQIALALTLPNASFVADSTAARIAVLGTARSSRANTSATRRSSWTEGRGQPTQSATNRRRSPERAAPARGFHTSPEHHATSISRSKVTKSADTTTRRVLCLCERQPPRTATR